MDRIDERIRAAGFSSLWEWLSVHPHLTWTEVGQELGVTPMLAIKKCIAEAPSREAAVRQGLLRELRRYFPQGWDSSKRWPRAKMSGMLASSLHLDLDFIHAVYAELDLLPSGWIPQGVDDEDLVRITKSLFSDDATRTTTQGGGNP